MKTVQEIAESILQVSQKTLILMRRDGDRFVLVEGLHRREACKALGETTIFGFWWMRESTETDAIAAEE